MADRCRNKRNKLMSILRKVLQNYILSFLLDINNRSSDKKNTYLCVPGKWIFVCIYWYSIDNLNRLYMYLYLIHFYLLTTIVFVACLLNCNNFI